MIYMFAWWFKDRKAGVRVALAILLALVIIFDAVLIYEAANPGEMSSGKSTAIGTAVAEAINNIAISFGEEHPPITDMNSFLAFFRKLVGHYGAFLLLGIPSSFFFLVGFNNKSLKWSIPLNFVHGLFMAALTEFIQLFTPGRFGAWSDIGIDFAGYCTSSIIISIVFVIIYLTRGRQKLQA